MHEPGGGDLVFIGDVHLGRDDPALADFLSFLEGLGATASRIVLLGDLFNVWIGGSATEQPHQTAVIERLVALRREGVVVRYLEGNRDYRVGLHYAGTALDDASDVGIVESFAGHSIYVTHGDLVNVEDRQYRTWRRLSRSRLIWTLFRALPRTQRQRVAEALEHRLRGTNLDHKREFPEAQVRDFAATRFKQGHDLLVLGHFHVQWQIEVDAAGAPGRVFVLPEWRESRRHLVARTDGRVAFVDS